MRKHELVMIEWVDSAQQHTGWFLDSEKPKGLNEVVNCFTVGYVVEKSDECVSIAQTKAGDNGDQFGGCARIPTRAILSITRIRKGAPLLEFSPGSLPRWRTPE